MNQNYKTRKFDHLEVIEYIPGRKVKNKRVAFAMARCRCECGKEFTPLWGNLISGSTQTCGCLRRNGYMIDETKFQSIDTPDSAYWLGMLLTDGCIGKTSQIILALQNTDVLHVENFRSFLGSNHPVTTEPRKIGKPTSKISVGSVQIARSLSQYGMIPRKTWTCRPWAGPDHLMSHFWRGCVDGDGSVLYYPSRPTAPRVGLCGNQHIVKAFAKYVEEKTGFTGHVRIWQTEKQKGGENFYGDARWATTPQAQAVVKLLGYSILENTALHRKRQAALEIEKLSLRDRHDDLPRDELLAKYSELGTWSKVAKFYGVTPGTMTYHVQKAGITFKGKYTKR